jgi:predicted DNA-binding protein (MmcQ/YjbR family)
MIAPVSARDDPASSAQPLADATPRPTGAELRELCLGLPDAREEFPFRAQLSVFKTSGKIFALSALAEIPLCVSVKCDPDLGAQLRLSHPAIVPGYHLNKRHWLTITIDGSLPYDLVVNLIEGSHELVTVRPTPRGRRNRRAP